MDFKRFLALLMAACLMLGLCACGGEGEPDATDSSEVTEATDVTEATVIENAQDGNVTYTVTVVDESGAPIAGVFVQMCLETCYPNSTNENGVATFSLAEADYKVSFLTPPEGYSVEEAYYFEDGAHDMTITLKAAA